MNGEDRAEQLLRQLGSAVVAELPPAARSAQLSRMTHVVERSLSRAPVARRRRRLAWGGAGLLAAAAVVLVLLGGPLRGSWRAPESKLVTANGVVSVLRPGRAHAEVGRRDMVLEGAAELSTLDASSAEVELPSGALLAVAASTRVRLPSDAKADVEHVELAEGVISLRVPHLSPGHTLSVLTPDATVTVRGTRVSVAVMPTAAGTVTSVAVEEGRVEVTSRGRSMGLGRGQRWVSAPLPESAPAASARVAAPDAPVQAPSKPPAAVASRVPGSPQNSHERSSLAEENRLFEQALRKASNGERDAALADLERFQREHPGSPLAQSVRVEHFKLLRDSGQRARAAVEARRYLSDYPNGFARDDARRTALYGVESTP